MTTGPSGPGRPSRASCKVVDFGDYTGLRREEHGRFANAGRASRRMPRRTVKNASLEQSNASVVDRMVQLTEVRRGFEGLQRGLTVLINDIDGRAITELGRR